mmetsp:Transcript_74289/g.227285  ORF Transcript_74289/g.227285 Transcript_74289/m.227285 type:complete len:218 (-) Transcript_74289:2403-3056(-)
MWLSDVKYNRVLTRRWGLFIGPARRVSKPANSASWTSPSSSSSPSSAFTSEFSGSGAGTVISGFLKPTILLRKSTAVVSFHVGSSSGCCWVIELLKSTSSFLKSFPQTTEPILTRLLTSWPYSCGTITSLIDLTTSQTGSKLLAILGWWIRSKRTASRISVILDTFQVLRFLSHNSSRSLSHRRWTNKGLVMPLQVAGSMTSNSLHNTAMLSCNCLK